MWLHSINIATGISLWRLLCWSKKILGGILILWLKIYINKAKLCNEKTLMKLSLNVLKKVSATTGLVETSCVPSILMKMFSLINSQDFQFYFIYAILLFLFAFIRSCGFSTRTIIWWYHSQNGPSIIFRDSFVSYVS